MRAMESEHVTQRSLDLPTHPNLSHAARARGERKASHERYNEICDSITRNGKELERVFAIESDRYYNRPPDSVSA